MNNTDFIKYNTIKEFLEKNDYYGLTVGKVSKNRLRRTFASIKWYTVDITVDTLRLNGENIVIQIKIDGEEANGMEDFRKRIAGIGKIHAQKRKQEVR
jgi:hypothetical protein